MLRVPLEDRAERCDGAHGRAAPAAAPAAGARDVGSTPALFGDAGDRALGWSLSGSTAIHLAIAAVLASWAASAGERPRPVSRYVPPVPAPTIRFEEPAPPPATPAPVAAALPEPPPVPETPPPSVEPKPEPPPKAAVRRSASKSSREKKAAPLEDVKTADSATRPVAPAVADPGAPADSSAGAAGPTSPEAPPGPSGTDPSETADAGAPDGVDADGLLRGYLARVSIAVRGRHPYPAAARRLGLEGRVVVELTVDAAGHVLGVAVAESSGHEVLDRAALEEARRVGSLPVPPTELRWGERSIRVPFRYELSG